VFCLIAGLVAIGDTGVDDLAATVGIAFGAWSSTLFKPLRMRLDIDGSLPDFGAAGRAEEDAPLEDEEEEEEESLSRALVICEEAEGRLLLGEEDPLEQASFVAGKCAEPRLTEASLDLCAR